MDSGLGQDSGARRVSSEVDLGSVAEELMGGYRWGSERQRQGPSRELCGQLSLTEPHSLQGRRQTSTHSWK